MWKIPRPLCEEFKIKYPTVVHGIVEQVQFTELTAKFKIHDGPDVYIQLPAEYEVPLIDLWVTKEQTNSVLNARDTAKCIDVLR